jgi:hypothetical protein
MTLRLAIIGTAGRGADRHRLTRKLWEALQADAARRIGPLCRDLGAERAELVLVSGGAAWADHLAVRLWRAGAAGALELYLPAPLDGRGFDRSLAVGRSMNHLHARFRTAGGCDSLAELCQAQRLGAAVTTRPGRAARNAAVAASADAVLAYTFGGVRTVCVGPRDPGFGEPALAGVDEPGTADTWARAQGARRKCHVPLACLEAT